MNLEEVARLAGVSRSTVSRVVNGDSKVSDAARARVQEIIATHNYHPNAAARSLASARTRIIGVYVPRGATLMFADPFFPQLIQGISAGCNTADHKLMLVMDSSESPTDVNGIYRRVIRGRHLDGIIIASSVIDEPLVYMLEQSGFPTVLVGRHPSLDISYVDVEDRLAAEHAVGHLLGHGRRRIATITGPANMIAAIDRLDGYRDALSSAGLGLDPALVIESDFTESGGHRAMRTLLSRGKGHIDAVFAGSDLMALGALRAIQDAGPRVPGDIALLGFDDIPRCCQVSPTLSSVFQPVSKLGFEAVDILIRLIEQPERAPIQRLLPTHLVTRESCGCGSSAAADC